MAYKVFTLDNITRIPLCSLPTPIIPMKNLTTHLGKAKLFVKRDDLTGLAVGGNKNRKLEYLLADALEKKATVIITEGALQSNHCLQTIACTKKIGLRCEVVLSGEEPKVITGNYLLSSIIADKIHRVKLPKDRKEKMKQLQEKYYQQGEIPYLIPTGGSTIIGALGYINFMREVAEYSKQNNISFDYIVHSTGSGGTQSGLILGTHFYYPEAKIIGISEGENKDHLTKLITKIITEFKKYWQLDSGFSVESINIFDQYYGEGYGLVDNTVIETIKLVANLEGIFLDPVYTGKAMVGLIDLVKKEAIPRNSNVLFLHSGGLPAIFHYGKKFIK